MSRLLVIQHTPSTSLRRLGDPVVSGARDDAIEGVEVVVRSPLEPDAEDVRSADAIVLGSAAHFGYMSGALKHFFDSVFLQVSGSLDASGAAGQTGSEPDASRRTPYGLWVHGRYDVTGAVRSVQSIVGALGWRQAAPVLEVMGDVGEGDEASAYELGATLAALVAD
jgi:NAD(P)H-dependent FMN reductase